MAVLAGSKAPVAQQGGQPNKPLLVLTLALAVCSLLSRPAWAHETVEAGPPSVRCYETLAREEYTHCAQLSPNFVLHWRVENATSGDASNDTTVQQAVFGLVVDHPRPSRGWVGLGLSEGGGMKGADLWALHRQPGAPGYDGRDGLQGWVVDDTWSEDFAAPESDEQQDLTLVSVSVVQQARPSGNTSTTPTSAGRVTAVLRRPLLTCDPSQDVDIYTGVTSRIVWAFGAGAWPSYHGEGARGEKVLLLAPLPSQQPSPQPQQQANDTAPVTTSSGPSDDTSGTNTTSPTTTTTTTTDGSPTTTSGSGLPGPTPEELEGAVVLELRMPNVSVPAKRTSYLCSHMPPMPTDAKYHVIRTEALVQSPLVHHMILFACSSPPSAIGDVWDCTNMGGDCLAFNFGWAPGVKVSDFPPEAGFAVGANSTVYYALQTHYNNPSSVAPPTPDASGFRLTLTPRLRQHDLRVLTLGQQNLVLPPGQPLVQATPSVCPSECTSRLRQPLVVIHALLHMHETGKTIEARHFRPQGNGSLEELPPLGRRRSWDFNFQSAAPVRPETATVLPGDIMLTTCTYDTTSRTQVTRFGEGTEDEMCFAFLVYYPLTAPSTTAATAAGSSNSTDFVLDACIGVFGPPDPAQQQQQQQGAEGGGVAMPPPLALCATAEQLQQLSAQLAPQQGQKGGAAVAGGPDVGGGGEGAAGGADPEEQLRLMQEVQQRMIDAGMLVPAPLLPPDSYVPYSACPAVL